MDPKKPVTEPAPEGEGELDRELLVLKATDGVDRVYQIPKAGFDASKLNKNAVECRVALPDGQGFRTVRQKC